MRRIDPVVDDADLHSLARGRERGAPDRGSADQLRRPVEQLVVGHARPHLGDASHTAELRDAPGRNDDGETVQHDAVRPPHARAGDRRPDPVLHRALCSRKRGQVRAARRGPQQQPVRAREGRVGERALVRDQLRERRRLEGHDDLDIRRVGGCCGHERKQSADE